MVRAESAHDKWMTSQQSGREDGVPIKVVVFDIGGVLEKVDDASWPERWIRRWECRMHLSTGHVAKVLAHQEMGDASTGELSEAQMRNIYAKALGLNEHEGNEMMAEM